MESEYEKSSSIVYNIILSRYGFYENPITQLEKDGLIQFQYDKNQPILFVEDKLKKISFTYMLNTMLRNIFLDYVPEWEPADLRYRQRLETSLRFNHNALYFSRITQVFDEYLRLSNEKREKYSVIPEYHTNLREKDFAALVTVDTSPMKEKDKYNVLDFVAAGLNLKDARNLRKKDITYKKLVESDFYDPNLPIDILLELIV